MRLAPHRLVNFSSFLPDKSDDFQLLCLLPTSLAKNGNRRTLNHEDYAAIADCIQYTKFQVCILSILFVDQVVFCQNAGGMVFYMKGKNHETKIHFPNNPCAVRFSASVQSRNFRFSYIPDFPRCC